MSKLTIKSPAPIGLADIAEQAAHSVEMMSQIRAAMLSPTTHKAAPVWNLSQLGPASQYRERVTDPPHEPRRLATRCPQ